MTLAAGSLPKGMRERVGDVLNWGPVDKCILAAGLTLPFVATYAGIAQYLRRRPSVVPYLDPTFLGSLLEILVVVAGAWGVLLVAGLKLRGRSPRSPLLVHATVQLYSVSNAFFIYCIGPYTSPLWLVLLGAGMIGLLIFDRSAMRLGIVSLLVIVGGTTLLERLGLIPYAPLLAQHPYAAPGRPADSWMAYMGGVSFSFTVITWALFAYIIARWREQEARLRELSTVDGLTRIANRRHFMEVFQQELERAERQRSRLACLMIDLDHFKQINDRHGHLVGDQVLVVVAQVLKERSRKADVVARYGGEEFALLLPEADVEGAMNVAERYRRAIEQSRIATGDVTLDVTASIGVACYPNGAIWRIDELLRQADAALYRAKKAGRNRVVLAEEKAGTAAPTAMPARASTA
jgi:diguanylate cyclase (GGDEF)-like protein